MSVPSLPEDYTRWLTALENGRATQEQFDAYVAANIAIMMEGFDYARMNIEWAKAVFADQQQARKQREEDRP